jgi:hypothetical protein
MGPGGATWRPCTLTCHARRTEEAREEHLRADGPRGAGRGAATPSMTRSGERGGVAGEKQLRLRERSRCRVDARVKDSARAAREHEGVVGEHHGNGPASAREIRAVEHRCALPGGREEAGGGG